jgi:anaerobic selenocysteine-containing dehydrogenase
MAKRVPGYCTLCRSRCGATAIVENGRLIGVENLPGHPTGGALCAKGRAAPEIVHSPRRLTKPLRRTAPRDAIDAGWKEISWDEALDEIAGKLGNIRQISGAEAVAFAVTTPSGTPMVDSFEWVERFIRCFGSPNLVYAVEVCGWHKDYAHALTFGRGIGFPDYERADAIVLWGHNPARTWLAQATRIADARRRGARVAVVDPKPNGSGQQADLWLRVRPGSDGALAMGAIQHLIAT